MNYRYEVRVYNDPKWYGNGVVFATHAEARGASMDKYAAWTAVESVRVVETDAPANYLWSPERGVHTLGPIG